MLDFDTLCSREVPSVAAMVYPFSGNHKQKFYWGHKEIMIPGGGRGGGEEGGRGGKGVGERGGGKGEGEGA